MNRGENKIGAIFSCLHCQVLSFSVSWYRGQERIHPSTYLVVQQVCLGSRPGEMERPPVRSPVLPVGSRQLGGHHDADQLRDKVL